MLEWLLLLAFLILCVVLFDCAWLKYQNSPAPLHDPHGALEQTARLTELCHGDRREADALIAAQKRLHPGLSHAEAVRLAMRQLLAPESKGDVN